MPHTSTPRWCYPQGDPYSPLGRGAPEVEHLRSSPPSDPDPPGTWGTGPEDIGLTHVNVPSVGTLWQLSTNLNLLKVSFLSRAFQNIL